MAWLSVYRIRTGHRLCAALLATTVGCEHSSSSPAVRFPAVADVVVGPAKADLDAQGRFRTAGARETQLGEISPERAKGLAVAYAERFGSGLRRPLFREHGGPIDFGSLSAAARVYRAESPYVGVTDAIPRGLRKRYSDFYMVHLLANAETPVLAAAVSVLNTHFVEDEMGTIRFYSLTGNDVFLFGIRGDEPLGFPMSPEEAVVIAHRSLGRRTADVPRLILPIGPYAPFFARWMIRLEHMVTVRGSDRREFSTDVVFVGHDRQLYAAATGISPDSSETRLTRRLAIDLRPDAAVHFVRIIGPIRRPD